MFELIKIGNHNVIDLAEYRFKAKFILGGYHSVQFNLNGSVRRLNAMDPNIDRSVFRDLSYGLYIVM